MTNIYKAFAACTVGLLLMAGPAAADDKDGFKQARKRQKEYDKWLREAQKKQDEWDREAWKRQREFEREAQKRGGFPPPAYPGWGQPQYPTWGGPAGYPPVYPYPQPAYPPQGSWDQDD